MREQAAPLKAEELLSHGYFVRSLARNLIRDEHRAEDVAQETWLAALNKPPEVSTKNALKAWLGKVTRNLAFRSHRQESRRMKRELAAATPTGFRSTEEVLEREAMRRQVVEAVMFLKEPYRSAILYRYYDDLMPMEIAGRLEMPVATVKTHIQRGLELLRHELKRHHTGSHRNWVLAMVPLAGFRLESTAGAATTASSLLFGGLIMAAKAKLAFTAVMLTGAIFTVWLVLPDESENQGAKEALVMLDPEVSADPSTSRVGDIPPTPEQSLNAKERIEPGSGLNLVPFEVKVCSAITRAAIPNFQIVVKENKSNRPFLESPKLILKETVLNRTGCFATQIPFTPSLNLLVQAPAFATEILSINNVHAQEGVTGLEIFLEPGLEVSGRVIDQASKQPVSGARVLSLAVLPDSEKKDLFDLSDYACLTDTEGKFLLSHIPDIEQTFVVLHPDYAEGLLTCRPTDSITIALVRGYIISGQMRNDDGSPCAGGQVQMNDMLDLLTRTAVADVRGYYALPPAAPGDHYLHATGPQGHDDPFLTSDFVHPIVEAGPLTINFGPSPRDAILEGTILSATSTPPPGKTRARFHWQGSPILVRSLSMDQNGFYRVVKLKPGSYAVSVQHPSFGGRVELGEIELASPGTHRADFKLPGGEVSGQILFEGKRVIPHAEDEIRLWYSDSSKFRIVQPDDQGRFKITGLHAGNYTLRAFSRDLGHTDHPPLELAENEVLDNLKVVFFPKGKLRVRFLGWETIRDYTEYSCSVTSIENGRSIALGKSWEELKKDAGIAIDYALEPGEYEICFNELAFPKQRAWIVVNQTTEMTFDLQRNDRPLTSLSAQVQYSNGKPIAGAWILMTLKQADKDAVRHNIYSGPDGRFEVQGLLPGKWKIWLNDPAAGTSLTVPDLEIPDTGPARIEKTFILNP